MAAEQEPALEESGPDPVQRRRRPIVRAIAVAGAGVLLLALVVAWLGRERIADDLIAGQLEAMGLPATYEIDTVGPRRQVLRNVVIGDPAHPDLTIERVEAVIEARWSGPAIGAITLVKPRLYGRFHGGKFSFGTLDPVIFAKGDGAPLRLPDMALAIEDGRGLLASDFGPVGVKLQGNGDLRGGFKGVVAALAPRLAIGGCMADRVSLYSRVAIEGERPVLKGPLRLARLDCPAQGVSLVHSGVQVNAKLDRSLDGLEGSAGLALGPIAVAGGRIGALRGDGRFAFRGQALNLRYDLTAEAPRWPQVAARTLGLKGTLRTSARFARVQAEGNFSGEALAMTAAADVLLADAERSGSGSLAAPLIAQLRQALRRESAGSGLAGDFIVRREPGETNVMVPQASLRGSSGATLLALSRFQMRYGASGPPRMGGNFATGGQGMPRIAGRLDRQSGDALVMRVTMAPYTAGTARIELPSLVVVQPRAGGLGFSGEARLSGALPGGVAENLVLPLQGNWSSRGGFALWRQCTTLRFGRLAFAELSFERRNLTLCPPRGGAIVRSDSRGTRIAAGATSLDLVGSLGRTPIHIRSGAVGVAVPGVLTARAVDVALGPPATASRFRIANLDARVGGDVAGRFAGSDVLIAAVPLDLVDASGAWRFAGGRLALTGTAFRLEDRLAADRFNPLVARDATLILADNAIVADALLREPKSNREVVRAAIRHDLSAGKGHADLAVTGILFDDRLQPDTLTPLALGVIANARGNLRGEGRIDWTPAQVRSHGRFATDALDFAAVFGPVKGASGMIEFTDLLGLVTAPGQQLRLASVNPGIEVNDGVLTYQLRPDFVLAIQGARWPFMDGALTLRPVTMTLGIAETRRYVLDIEALNAARFVERLELANIAATGVFDGTLPLVFDENGGRIEGGALRSRSQGGNVAYVGALTYEDLSPMANFAFDALKSLDYRDMTIAMDGALAGELVTRVSLSGVKQGATAKRNFLTDRVAKLPIRFNINLRAPFLQLMSSFKSLYDPAYVRDPRTLGLIDERGQPVRKPAPKPTIQP